ncbi:hypothetical protein CBW65_06085 [Tumebacillus avium]|uniref:Thioredoxin domain-containing protein n=1 Tax=Tumebacillus avium TaxID=1903704 RepID=A0A1Y0IJK6_9BACL|nr:hypothetical protein [Tumebacillus avium]ARU60701.1 hypothetical protein CBW65_06085 [Tumebacillus avium]
MILLAANICFWIILVVVVVLQLKKYNSAIALLPQKSQHGVKNRHPALGINLRDYVPAANQPPGKPLLVMASMPTCASCHSQLEEVLEALETQSTVRFMVLLTEGEPGFESFLEKYQSVVPIITAPRQTMMNLYIFSFPTFIFLDDSGVIQDLRSSSLAAMHFIRSIGVE